MAKSKAGLSAKRWLERLRSHEPVSAIAEELGVQAAEVALARELVRHVGEHQATSAGRLPDALAQAVVEAALQIEHAGFLKAVAEQGSKAASSAAKRGLAILRSKGIEVDLAPQGEAVFRAEAESEEIPGLLSTCDPHGDRLLWIPTPMRGGGLQVATVLLSESEGILRVETDELSRKALRRMREDLTRRGAYHGVSVREIPVRRARGLVALARAGTRSGLSIEDEAQLTNLLGDACDAAPPATAEPELAAPLEEQRLRESASLHDEVEARHWFPEPDAVRAFGLKLDEIGTSQLYLDEGQRSEQADREASRAADEYFAGARSAPFAARLFDLADALQSKGAAEASQRAAAAARALQRGVAPSSIPFCRRMFEKLVESAAAQQRPSARPAEASSLILPGAAAE